MLYHFDKIMYEFVYDCQDRESHDSDDHDSEEHDYNEDHDRDDHAKDRPWYFQIGDNFGAYEYK